MATAGRPINRESAPLGARLTLISTRKTFTHAAAGVIEATMRKEYRCLKSRRPHWSLALPTRVDTGAQENILPYSYVHKIETRSDLQLSKTLVTSYESSSIRHFGAVKLLLRRREKLTSSVLRRGERKPDTSGPWFVRALRTDASSSPTGLVGRNGA